MQRSGYIHNRRSRNFNFRFPGVPVWVKLTKHWVYTTLPIMLFNAFTSFGKDGCETIAMLMTFAFYQLKMTALHDWRPEGAHYSTVTKSCCFFELGGHYFIRQCRETGKHWGNDMPYGQWEVKPVISASDICQHGPVNHQALNSRLWLTHSFHMLVIKLHVHYAVSGTIHKINPSSFKLLVFNCFESSIFNPN